MVTQKSEFYFILHWLAKATHVALWLPVATLYAHSNSVGSNGSIKTIHTMHNTMLYIDLYLVLA